MNYHGYQEMTLAERRTFLANSVESFVANLNSMRLTFDGTLFEIERELYDDGSMSCMVIKCPFDTLAWKIAMTLEACSSMSVVVEDKKVVIDI